MSFNYRFSSRKLACSNARFDVCFDALECSDGTKLPNFLTVRPRVRDAKTQLILALVLVLGGMVGVLTALIRIAIRNREARAAV